MVWAENKNLCKENFHKYKVHSAIIKEHVRLKLQTNMKNNFYDNELKSVCFNNFLHMKNKEEES